MPSTAEPSLQPSSRTSCRITAVLKPAQMCRKAGLPPAAGGCGAVEPLTGFYSGSDNHESPSPSMASPAERDPVWWLGCRIERQLDHRWSHLLTPNNGLICRWAHNFSVIGKKEVALLRESGSQGHALEGFILSPHPSICLFLLPAMMGTVLPPPQGVQGIDTDGLH